jgi:hypothetical protein
MLAVPAREIQRTFVDLKILASHTHHPADAWD